MDKPLASKLESAKASDERSERQCPPVPKAASWLVFPHGKGRKFQSFYNPCEPNNRNCIKSIPEMQGKAYYHKTCHKGWLIVIGNVGDKAEYFVADATDLDDCFLWNPVSSETIQLPNLDRQSFSNKSKKYYMFDLVLSSPPLPNTSSFSNRNPANDDGCTVFLIFRSINSIRQVSRKKQILVFCRPGDKQWSIKELDFRYDPEGDFSIIIDTLLCFRGKLYAFGAVQNWVIEIGIQKLWHHVLVDKETQFLRKFKVELPDYFPVYRANFPLISGGEEYARYMQDWVESGDEIFKVVLNCSPRGYSKVGSTHIFKLDFSSMTWVLLKSLGDHVLFLCTNMDTEDLKSRKCYSTSSAHCSAADMGLERGCLFYTLPEDQTLYIFEPEDNATTVFIPCLEIPTPCFLPTWIMMPTTVNRQVGATRRRITDFLVSQDTTETSIEQEENMSRLNNSGEELKPWDFLDDYDSIEEIARFLHPVDYIHFRVACKQNSIFLPALNRILAFTRTTSTTYLSPWLISIFANDEDTICNMVDPMHSNEKYLMKLSDQLLVDARIRFSKYGWLLMSSGKKTIFFYNPFTGATIRLPDLPDGYTLGGMSFSSLPTSPDCVVIAISNWYPGDGEDYINFLVTKPGKSATGWTTRQFIYESTSESRCESTGDYLHGFMPCINNPVFYKGKFYCLDYNGLLGVFNTTGDFTWKILSTSLKQFSSLYPSYLVECDDKLLLVNVGQSGKPVRIYRLDDWEMMWLKLKSLGKHALFISYTSSFSTVAPRSCMENKIYFPRLYGERILYYSLDTRRYHCVGSNQHSLQNFHNTKERSNCTWIEPSWLDEA